MGAGKGQIRRVSAAAPARPNYDAWFKFVLPQEVGMVTLSDYYGVRKVEKLALEIIQDMEAIGIFTFPPGASIDNFHVYIANDQFSPSDSRRGNFLFIRRTFPNGKRPRARVRHSEP